MLVVGGAGYVGSHAVRALVDAGRAVVIVDDLSTGHRDLVPAGIPLIEGSAYDARLIGDVARRHDVGAVMHFAARSLVGESVEKPREYFEANCAGAMTLVGALLDHGVRHVVFSSTAAVFGEPDAIPIPDAAPRRPQNPYGVTKAFIEDVLANYRSAGLSSVSLRYFNAAGADASAQLGEHHAPETHLIPLVLDAALGLRKVTVFGDDWPTRDGTCLRDYVHVSDLADAHLRALTLLESAAEPIAERLNLGSNSGTTVREVIATVEQVTGNAVPHEIGPRRAGDPAALVASCEGAARVLGWRPTRGIATIVEDAWRWHRRLRGR